MGRNRCWVVLRELVQCEGPSVGSPQRNRDSRKVLDSNWRTPWPNRLGMNAHRLAETFDLGFFDLNATLSAGTALEIVDREGLAPQHKLPGIGSRQPVVETRDGNSESLRGVLGRQQGRRHPTNHIESRQFE